MPAARRLGDAAAGDLRVGVGGGDDDASDAGGDEGVGAGRGAAVVRAGLKGDVGGCAMRVMALGGSLFEGYDFGMVAGFVEVGSAAYDSLFEAKILCQDAGLPAGLGEARATVSRARARAWRMNSVSACMVPPPRYFVRKVFG